MDNRARKTVKAAHDSCKSLEKSLLSGRDLIIASNRGPVSISRDTSGQITYQRGGGGLVTALLGLVENVNACWVATAENDTEREWKNGRVALFEDGAEIDLEFICPDEDAFDKFYNQISNPLLWFLQHSMWDFVRSPTFTRSTWDAWDDGYVSTNQLFADFIAGRIRNSTLPTLVMLQDYHLYLAPRMIRKALGHSEQYTLTHFIHIPWPGAEDWGFLPMRMRQSILEGLCGLDLLGFQTQDDGMNFIRTVESHLPGASVNFSHGHVWYANHTTHVHDFPISIDVESIQRTAQSVEVKNHRQQIEEMAAGHKLILRIDRTEPSKNIVRGFQAFEELLEMHPEHVGKVIFLALLVPSRLGVEEYQNYLDEIMAAAGRINARYASSDWEPVRVLLGEDYARAVAALQVYDVLLVNAIADGMNLVAKEGSVVNEQNGVLVLSERTGARQQLERYALVISPCDLVSTSEALHKALTMSDDERSDRSQELRRLVEANTINDWFCNQLRIISTLGL